MEKYEVIELTAQEMKSTEGGIVVALVCIGAALLLSSCRVLKNLTE